MSDKDIVFGQKGLKLLIETLLDGAEEVQSLSPRPDHERYETGLRAIKDYVDERVAIWTRSQLTLGEFIPRMRFQNIADVQIMKQALHQYLQNAENKHLDNWSLWSMGNETIGNHDDLQEAGRALLHTVVLLRYLHETEKNMIAEEKAGAEATERASEAYEEMDEYKSIQPDFSLAGLVKVAQDNKDVMYCVSQGRKISAIQALRQVTGASLLDAKLAIEEIMR